MFALGQESGFIAEQRPEVSIMEMVMKNPIPLLVVAGVLVGVFYMGQWSKE